MSAVDVSDLVYSSDFVDFRNRTNRYNSQEFIDIIKEALQISSSYERQNLTGVLPEYAANFLFVGASYMDGIILCPPKNLY